MNDSRGRQFLISKLSIHSIQHMGNTIEIYFFFIYLNCFETRFFSVLYTKSIHKITVNTNKSVLIWSIDIQINGVSWDDADELKLKI